MATSYSANLALSLPATGELSGTWGGTENDNIGQVTTNTGLGLEAAISGYVTQAITDGADTTITIPNGATGVARNMYLELTAALSAARNLLVPANRKLYFIYNNTTGGYAVTVKVSGQTGVSVPNGKKVLLVSNGTDIVEALLCFVGHVTLEGVTATGATGTGKIVFDTAPTLGVVTLTTVNKVTITAPANSATLTIADSGSLITSGAYAVTLTATATTNVTLPTSGTLATTASVLPRTAAGGTVDAITADFTPDLTLSDQMMCAVIVAGANTTTTPTFAPDGLTAHTITKRGGQALVAGDIASAGFVAMLEYNSANTRWELLNPAVSSGGMDVLSYLADSSSFGGF